MKPTLLTLILVGFSFMGFAAPGFLGVALEDVNANVAKELKLAEEYGARIADVLEGKPGDKAGLEVDDVVVGYNGQRVESVVALQRMVRETPAGREVQLDVIRDEVRINKTAKLEQAPAQEWSRQGPGTWQREFSVPPDFFEHHPWMKPPPGHGRPKPPPPPPEKADPGFPVPGNPPRLGIMVQPLELQLADYLGVEPGTGLWIAEVDPEGRAAKAGVQGRDILVKFHGAVVKTAEDITRTMVLHSGKDLELELLRKGEKLTVTVKAEQPEPAEDGEEDEVL